MNKNQLICSILSDKLVNTFLVSTKRSCPTYHPYRLTSRYDFYKRQEKNLLRQLSFKVHVWDFTVWFNMTQALSLLKRIDLMFFSSQQLFTDVFNPCWQKKNNSAQIESEWLIRNDCLTFVIFVVLITNSDKHDILNNVMEFANVNFNSSRFHFYEF